MKRILACACVGFLLVSGTTMAQDQSSSSELEELRRLVERQNKVITDLLQRIEALEAQQEEQSSWIETEKTEQEKPVWTDNVRLKGDFRYRHELIRDDSRHGDRDDDRNRHRIRARVGLEAKLNESVDIGFQISTGEVVDANGKDEGDPISNNQTLTNAWSLKNIWLSEAYANWHPAQTPGVQVVAGKMHRPFITPVASELVWDSDVNPEGAAIKYEKSFDSFTLMTNGYGFWVVERSAEGDSGLFGGQAAIRHDFGLFADKAHIMGGASYYDFGNVENERLFVNGDSFGNTTDPAGTQFAEDFNVVELFGEFGFGVRSTPLAFFADYVNNAATSDEDTGWSLGLRVGKAINPKSFEFRYLYKDLEPDSVFGTFTDSDFGGGGTDSKGHEMNLVYQLAKNWQLAISYFHNEINVDRGDEDDYQRLQLDALLKF